jgi:hypothetical protein
MKPQKSFDSEILPFVYKKDNEFEISPDFDPNRKLWGFRLKSGILLKATCGSGDDVGSINWNNCKAFAESMTLNGKQGRLPSKYLFEEYWGDEEMKAVEATSKFLAEIGVDSDGYRGLIWCNEEFQGHSARCFSLSDGANKCDYFRKILVNWEDRLGVFFE